MRRHSPRTLVSVVLVALVASTALFGAPATEAVAKPSADVLSPTLPIDPKSTLTVHPALYGNTVVAVATFAKPYLFKNRPVSLQRWTGSEWREVKAAKMDAKGRTEFKLTKSTAYPYDTYTYRAATEKFKYKKKAQKLAATDQVNLAEQWTRTFNDQFSGTKIDENSWSTRADGVLAGSRLCSAPDPNNVKVSDGKLSLTMKKAGSALQAEANKVARAAQQAAKDKAVAKAEAQLKAAKTAKAKKKAKAAIKKAKAIKITGCAKGVYTNAMIGTNGKFNVERGIIAARVKFPRGQGMHGSAWLQSAGGQELDFVESYGYGKGITNVIHVPSGGKLVRLPAKPADGYVLKSDVKKSSWWDKYHVFSMEWNTQWFEFRVDGKVTKRIAKPTDIRQYFVVLSLLSSDWELPLLTKPGKGAKGVKKATLPSSMLVDWVQVWEKA